MADAEQGVLLYYKFVKILDPVSVCKWFEKLCSSLCQLGRVRVAPDGVNTTIGGTMASLKLHINAVEEHDAFRGCDFKLATCLHPVNQNVAADCGFNSLSVRLVKELVTLGISELPSLDYAGKHLSPKEFHSMIEKNAEGTILLDARNIYETRIGKFSPPPGVEFLDPKIRQYSDLPVWIDSHIDSLRNKSILMYCTGGVRCEMASAYIRSKGDGFGEVFQLSGGIQRYLESFPEGGYFQGKNFVFDHRISVASSGDAVVGCCLRCAAPFDDYSQRTRCSFCRMLVLVCNKCQLSASKYVCELCGNSSRSSDIPQQLATPAGKRKLKILCLHGFRQNASNMKGRMASFTKKLKKVADFVFVDAPHELQLIYDKSMAGEFTSTNIATSCTAKKKYGWMVSPSAAGVAFDAVQYKSQIKGWKESLERIEKAFCEMGPLDGVLGFSQGAAVAASLAFLKSSTLVKMRFVVLCSGFPSPAEDVVSDGDVCSLPSLHIFCDGHANKDDDGHHGHHGHRGYDRQISSSESERLVSMFAPALRVVVRHSSGHMIPTQPHYMEQYLNFFSEFM